MRQIARNIAVIVSVGVGAAVGLGSAFACSCEQPPPNVDIRDEKQLRAWKLEKANDVVRAQILSVSAGDDILLEGQRFVAAQVKIASVLKGGIPPGDATILSLFGGGDCGIGPSLLLAYGWRHDVILEVRKIPDRPGKYLADMCGYGQTTPASSAPARQ
jgi:hypothetical protein